MNLIILMDLHPANTPGGYAIGALIALFILGYLVYSLIKPEKF